MSGLPDGADATNSVIDAEGFALSHEKNAVADVQFEQQLEQKLWPQLALSIDINLKKIIVLECNIFLDKVHLF